MRVVANARKPRSTHKIERATDAEQASFLQDLVGEDPVPVALSLFGETAEVFRCQRVVKPSVKLPQPLREWYSEANLHLSEEALMETSAEFARNLKITEEQVNFLEEQTRGQAQSTVWLEQRPGHITASFAHSVIRTDQDNPAPSVVTGVTRKMSSVPIQVASLAYGRENEDLVFGHLNANIARDHENGQLHKTGMRIAVDNPWLSATADGVVTCACHGKLLVEIKCPYSARHMTCAEFMADESSYLFEGQLNPNHAYYTQIQIQMKVYGVNQCLFIVKLKDGFIICTIPKNDPYINDLVPKLEKFWKRHIVRELLTRSVENFKKASEPPKDNKLYCYCEQLVTDELMIGCDGVNCPYNGWVHFNCIRPKRKTLPKGTWYCKACKKCK